MNIRAIAKTTLKKYNGLIFALGTIVLAELLFNTSLPATLGTNLFQAIERRGFDILMRARGVRANGNDLIMIKVDDYTDKLLGWPIPRDQYGAVMTLLSNSGAKAVALDAPLPPKNDIDTLQNRLLVEYLKKAQGTFQVIGPYIPSKTERAQISKYDVDSSAYFAISRFGIPAPHNNHFPRAPIINDYPFAALADVSTGIGHVSLIPDTLDGVIRSVPLFIEYAGDLYPSLGMALAMYVLKIDPKDIHFEDTESGTIVRAGSLEIHTGLWGEIPINYIGKGNAIPSVSFYDVLIAAKQGDDKFFDQFKNKVCIIGPTIRSVGDYYANPVEESAAGFLAHANIYDMITTNNFFTRAGEWIQFPLLLFMSFAIGFVAHNQRMRTGIVLLFTIAIAYSLFAYCAFAFFNLWFNIAQPLFALFLCYVSTVAYRAATEGKQRKMITDIFGRYVDSTVVNILINNPSLVKLGGEKREISILFSDIKGFSTISEKVNDETLVTLLNVYMTDMTNVILKHQGTVDKFIGDAIMAFWGAPLKDENATFHACVTALEMQYQLEQLQPKLYKIGNVEVRQRIGINTGTCTVGNMGSEQRQSYTAIGDPVNLASRLEGANKQYGTYILISETTYQQVVKRVVAREVDRVQVVGKTEPTRIYELISLADKPLTDKMKYFYDIFAEGLKAYQERRWDEGIAYMEHALKHVPNDPVCQLYIERMRLYQISPPKPDWNGVFVLHTK
jgi:adenylate cyclase